MVPCGSLLQRYSVPLFHLITIRDKLGRRYLQVDKSGKVNLESYLNVVLSWPAMFHHCTPLAVVSTAPPLESEKEPKRRSFSDYVFVFDMLARNTCVSSYCTKLT